MLSNIISTETAGYWRQRIMPPILYGSKHALLFQMALLPLSMCRHTIALASSTAIRDFIPLGRMHHFHIYVGYVLVAITVIDAVMFGLYFRSMCNLGNQSFCAGLRSEIMITGYFIAGTCATIGITSLLRHRIRYEIFYLVHQSIFILFVLVVAHTFDGVHRSGQKSRSQAFYWVTGSLLYYVCDRLSMHLSKRYTVPVTHSAALTSSGGTRLSKLALKRPPLFQFLPGQYALLRFRDIDAHWHPFTIASGPESSMLEFHIEVFTELSWTNRLWWRFRDYDWSCEQDPLEFEVKGPYGEPICGRTGYSHMISIGSGTGIVSSMSQLKQHVRALVQTDPQHYFKQESTILAKVAEIHKAQDRRSGSFCEALWQKKPMHVREVSDRTASLVSSKKKIFASVHGYDPRVFEKEEDDNDVLDEDLSLFDLETEFQEANNDVDRKYLLGLIKKRVQKREMSFVLKMVLPILPVYGFSVLALTLSWNNLSIDTGIIMGKVLMGLSIAFHVLFVLMVLGRHERSSLSTLVDIAVGGVALSIDAAFTNMNTWMIMQGNGLFTISLLHIYMIVRLFITTTSSKKEENRKVAVAMDDHVTSRKLHFIWVTRSAQMVSELAPVLEAIWQVLVDKLKHDEDLVKRVCEIKIFVTDPNSVARKKLADDMQIECPFLSRCNAFLFSRPNFGDILESHARRLMEKEKTRKHTDTLVSFCGSPSLSSIINASYMEMAQVLFLLGKSSHHIHYHPMVYGASKVVQKASKYNYISPVPSQQLESTTVRLSGASETDGDSSAHDSLSKNETRTETEQHHAPPVSNSVLVIPERVLRDDNHLKSVEEGFPVLNMIG